MSQNFLLFLVSNLSVLNFQVFLLIYPGPACVRLEVPPPEQRTFRSCLFTRVCPEAVCLPARRQPVLIWGRAWRAAARLICRRLRRPTRVPMLPTQRVTDFAGALA